MLGDIKTDLQREKLLDRGWRPAAIKMLGGPTWRDPCGHLFPEEQAFRELVRVEQSSTMTPGNGKVFIK